MLRLKVRGRGLFGRVPKVKNHVLSCDGMLKGVMVCGEVT